MRTTGWPLLRLTVVALATSGCLGAMIETAIRCPARVPLAASELDAQAKKMVPGSEKALIYVYRNPKETLGCAMTILVTLDDRVAGQTAPMTYFVWAVDPGKHEITSLTQSAAKLPLVAEAGKTYFVAQEVKLYGGSELRPVDDATGRAAVAECRLIQDRF